MALPVYVALLPCLSAFWTMQGQVLRMTQGKEEVIFVQSLFHDSSYLVTYDMIPGFPTEHLNLWQDPWAITGGY